MVLKAKHIVEEISGQRCTVVEKAIEKDRCEFLKNLLQHNGFTVVLEEVAKTDEAATQLYNLGVTDLVFNPVISVYEMALPAVQIRVGYLYSFTESKKKAATEKPLSIGNKNFFQFKYGWLKNSKMKLTKDTPVHKYSLFIPNTNLFGKYHGYELLNTLNQFSIFPKFSPLKK